MRTVLLTTMVALAACSGGDPGTPPDPIDITRGPVEVVDLLPQTLVDPVEIMVVLDPSWTDGMAELQPEVLNDAFETLLLADPAWRIGMLDATATGPRFGLLGPKFETWPYPTNVFDVDASSNKPKIRESIYTALELRKEQEANAEFLRADSELYILVFTDKEDGTDDVDDGITKPAFEDWLDGFEPSNAVRIGVLTTSEREDYWKARAYGGGEVFVAGAFRRGLSTLFRDAIRQKVSFTLNYTPSEPPGLVDVIYREHRTEYLLDQDYTYDADTRSITFIDVVPRVDSVVRVRYRTEDDVVTETETTGTDSADTGTTTGTTTGTP